MEKHPIINEEQPKLSQSKIILGSFPIWSLTPPDLEKNENLSDKLKVRQNSGDYPYFYGSSTNLFWIWYKKYLDDNIEIGNPTSIQNSLDKRNIGITDMIFECKRKGKSALDKHLSKRVYNHSFFKYPNEGEVLKLLCTSKGVMNDMLLNDIFFKKHVNLRLDLTKSISYQKKIIDNLDGSFDYLSKPFFKSLITGAGGIIECFSIPSPGSPFRKLSHFGLGKYDKREFLDRYLNIVFNWFCE